MCERECEVGGNTRLEKKQRKSLGGFSKKTPLLAAARRCEARDCVFLGVYETFILLCFAHCLLFFLYLVLLIEVW